MRDIVIETSRVRKLRIAVIQAIKPDSQNPASSMEFLSFDSKQQHGDSATLKLT
jgi:hypothetical protein